jgi:hypothetical protein
MVIHMKTPKISKLKAVAAVVMICIIAMPAVSAGGLIKTHYGYTPGGDDDWNEQPDFPADVPENGSSLTCICARRGWDIWNRQVYDVGFAIYVMRKCDGEPHVWNFVGSIVTRYEDENGPVEEAEYSSIMYWDSETSIGFDIVIGGVHTEPTFYTKTLTGRITIDGPDAPRTYSRTFYGRDYLNNNNVNILVSLFLFFSLVTINAAADNPDVDIAIEGGMGWRIEVYNNGTQNVPLNYTVLIQGLFSGKIARNCSGSMDCPPGLSIYLRVISILTLCPFARITVTTESCGTNLTREGIVLFSSLVFFSE